MQVRYELRAIAQNCSREPNYFLAQNFPTPSRNCSVFIPGFGDDNPAFEMCI